MELIKNMCPNCFLFHYQGSYCPDCGFSAKPETHPGRAMAAGTLVGRRYYIGRVLGFGGFGITYKAYDAITQKVCAIKEYAPAGITFRNCGERTMQISMTSGKSVFEHGMERFIQEARRLKQLSYINDVVKIMACFKENQTAYFVMEYLDGTNLKQVVRMAGGCLNIDEITRMIAGIGKAMSAIHQTSGILHRDITPENICLLRDGSARLLDFGSARQKTMDERQEFSVEFKRGFAPPEQYYRTGKQGPYTDVYALAATYYYALTGTMVIDAMERLDGKSCPPLKALRPEVGVRISDVVEQALALDYRQRIQTMDQFVEGICPGFSVYQEDPPAAAEKPYIEMLSGEKTGTRWEIEPGNEIRVGRSPGQSHIIITGNPAVSKLHCVIAYDEESHEFRIEDFSRNGTYVNGSLLSQGQIHRYQPDIVISLSNRMCQLKAGVSDE